MKRFSFTTHLVKKISSGVLLFAILLAMGTDAASAHAPDSESSSKSTLDPVLTPDLKERVAALESRVAELTHDKEEILWLGRVICSESSRPDEQRLIAWVVRNRVENGFRGTTYKEVALSKNQFSGLTYPGDPNRFRNLARDYGQTDLMWVTCLEIAREVYFAPADERPFSKDVMHFFSPNVVATPAWAQGREPVHRSTDGNQFVRFAFYAKVQ